MVHGPGSPHIAELAEKIAEEEEEEHANELAERILELGGELPYGIEKLYELANCKTMKYPEDLNDLKGYCSPSRRPRPVPLRCKVPAMRRMSRPSISLSTSSLRRYPTRSPLRI